MYLRFAVAVFLLASSAPGNVEGAKCGSGEVYTTCGGCDPTCDPSSSACGAVCREGCFCASGYLRNRENKCVLPQDCPAACPLGEEFRKCGVCDATCSRPIPECKNDCPNRCSCLIGWVRDKNNRCIPATSCPSDCPPDKIWRNYGPCERTCKNPDPTCQVNKWGCYCTDDKVRDANGNCIYLAWCP